MKTNLAVIITVLLALFISSNLIAQDTLKTKNQNKNDTEQKTILEHGVGFVDEDGDGYNDNAPDHDGDGIPNGLDPDYKKLKLKSGFVDLDGDGINDNRGMGKMQGNWNGLLNNAFGEKGVGAQNGNVSGTGNDNSNENGNINKGSKGKGKHK